MRWRALSDAAVYVRQRPEEGKLTVAEVRLMLSLMMFNQAISQLCISI